MSDPPTPTQTQADALKLQAHGVDEAQAPPAVVDVPAVSGTGAPGSTLTCTKGNWTGEPTSYAYAWQDASANLGVGDTYAVTEADIGRQIVCVVTAGNAFGQIAAPPSNAVTIAAAVAQAAKTSTVKPPGDQPA